MDLEVESWRKVALTSPMTRDVFNRRMMYSAMASFVLCLMLGFFLSVGTPYSTLVELEIVITFWVFLYTSYWWRRTAHYGE